MPGTPFDAELQRTAFQKKGAVRIPPEEVLELAVDFFRERGYRASLTGRPGQMFVMGGKEGGLPRVTGEIFARGNVGKPGTTLVTFDAAGERLAPTMREFLARLRDENRRRREAARS